MLILVRLMWISVGLTAFLWNSFRFLSDCACYEFDSNSTSMFCNSRWFGQMDVNLCWIHDINIVSYCRNHFNVVDFCQNCGNIVKFLSDWCEFLSDSCRYCELPPESSKRCEFLSESWECCVLTSCQLPSGTLQFHHNISLLTDDIDTNMKLYFYLLNRKMPTADIFLRAIKKSKWNTFIFAVLNHLYIWHMYVIFIIKFNIIYIMITIITVS